MGEIISHDRNKGRQPRPCTDIDTPAIIIDPYRAGNGEVPLGLGTKKDALSLGQSKQAVSERVLRFGPCYTTDVELDMASFCGFRGDRHRPLNRSQFRFHCIVDTDHHVLAGNEPVPLWQLVV